MIAVSSASAWQRHRLALLGMGFAVACFSLLPLLVDLSGTHVYPTIMVGVWMATHGLAGICTVATAAHLDRSSTRPLPAELRRYAARIPLWCYAGLFLASFQWLAFTWSARMIETAVTAVVFECWPLAYVLTRGGLDRLWPGTGRSKQRLTLRDFGACGAAAAGMALVVFSERGADGPGEAIGSPIAGFALAVLALAGSWLSSHFLIGAGEVANRRSETSADSSTADKLICSLVGHAIPRFTAGLLVLVWGLASYDGTSSLWATIGFGAALGCMHCTANYFWVASNHTSPSDNINCLCFLIPVAALGWLWAFTDIEVGNQALLAVGVVVVAGANTALYLNSGRRTG